MQLGLVVGTATIDRQARVDERLEAAHRAAVRRRRQNARRRSGDGDRRRWAPAWARSVLITSDGTVRRELLKATKHAGPLERDWNSRRHETVTEHDDANADIERRSAKSWRMTRRRDRDATCRERPPLAGARPRTGPVADAARLKHQRSRNARRIDSRDQTGRLAATQGLTQIVVERDVVTPAFAMRRPATEDHDRLRRNGTAQNKRRLAATRSIAIGRAADTSFDPHRD